MAEDLSRTPLEAEHAALGAKLGPFGGWLLPIEYAGTLAEHAAVRERVGVFDVSHLGKVELSGPAALEALQRTLTNDVSRVDVGAAQYGMALNDQGGIVDDLIVYRTGRSGTWWCRTPPTSTASTSGSRRALPRVARSRSGTTSRSSRSRARGRRRWSARCSRRPGRSRTCTAPSRRGRDRRSSSPAPGTRGSAGTSCSCRRRLPRTSGGGSSSRGRPSGIEPCGLAARDTLRLEMGYPLHGNDIDQDHTPVEAGLTWAVAMGKGEFPGRAAVERQLGGGPAAAPGRPPDAGPADPAARTTACSPATTGWGRRPAERSRRRFASASRSRTCRPTHAEPGARLEVDVRGRRGGAEVVRPPFVDSSPR